MFGSEIHTNRNYSCLKMSENCQKSAKTAEGTIFSLAFFAPEILNERDGSFRTYDLAKTALFALFGIFRTWGISAPISTVWICSSVFRCVSTSINLCMTMYDYV